MAEARPSSSRAAEEMQKRLDELGEDIEKTRRQAEDRGLIPDDDGARYHESGDIRPDLDDQTITPPG